MYTEMQRFWFWDFFLFLFNYCALRANTRNVFCDIWAHFSIASRLTEVKAKLRNDFQTRHGFVGTVSWLSKKGGNPLPGVAQWKKEIPKATKRPFLCLLNNVEICSSYKSHACLFFLPTSDFIQQQECDIMGLHSESSDSVLPLATCPARIPLCKHSRNTRGPAVREGNPFLSTSPPHFCLYRTGPVLWFGLWAGFFFPSVVTAAPPAIFHWDQLCVPSPKRRQTNVWRLLATVCEWDLCVAEAAVYVGQHMRIRAVQWIDFKSKSDLLVKI